MEAMNGIPPQIPGYTFAQKLGSGSEANVYLYQQLSPSRQVAIKVSKGTLDPRAAARFRSEANFMGRISSHPYILSVYESGITATGNGYTVFEYAPGGNYRSNAACFLLPENPFRLFRQSGRSPLLARIVRLRAANSARLFCTPKWTCDAPAHPLSRKILCAGGYHFPVKAGIMGKKSACSREGSILWV